MTIEEVYEKYKHLDHLLDDKQWLLDSFRGRMLYDFWQAIKSAQHPFHPTGAGSGESQAEGSDARPGG